MLRDDCQKHEDLVRRVGVLEDDICYINKPEKGALSSIHEKINTGFSERPRWSIFLAIMSLIVSVLLGSYGYTYMSTQYLADEQKKLVTKEYFLEFKEDILREIRKK